MTLEMVKVLSIPKMISISGSYVLPGIMATAT